MHLLVSLLLCAVSPARAAGPFGTAGIVVTPKLEFTDTTGTAGYLEPLLGPAVRLGWEIGDHWNHEFAFQWTSVGSKGEFSDVPITLGFSTYAVGYRFAWEALGKKGFTPYVGVGLYTGYAAIEATASQGGQTGFQDGGTVFLEFHLALGFRYSFKSGLNLRFDVAGSTFGGFIAAQPTFGVGYQF